jgi:hypothetical protein
MDWMEEEADAVSIAWCLASISAEGGTAKSRVRMQDTYSTVAGSRGSLLSIS